MTSQTILRGTSGKQRSSLTHFLNQISDFKALTKASASSLQSPSKLHLLDAFNSFPKSLRYLLFWYS